MTKDQMIEIENINVPGKTNRVNAQKYGAMREVLLKVLPEAPPGMSQAQMGQAVLPYLPENLWPDGAKSMWWVKTVQLDLEAKGLLTRCKSGNLTHWHRV